MGGIRVPGGYWPGAETGAALEQARKRGEHKSETLIRCGRFLYGQNWVTPLSRALDPPVNRSNVSKWRNGKDPIPEHYLDQVIFLADEKRREIAKRLRSRTAA